MIINDDFRNYLHLFTDDVYVVSDPPYNQKYHYNHYKDNASLEEYKELLAVAFSDNKSVVIHYPEETINILSKVNGIGNCEDSIAWIYNSNTGKQHRLITWWGGCKPDYRKIGQPYKNPTDKRIAKKIAEGKEARGYDWWEIQQVKNVSKKDNPHPCPIPYTLAEKIILSTTKEGDTVIDPFAGSGTVLLACKNNNRKYIGFEIDKVYFDYMKSIGL